nr:HEAT repeat domain-containing protein [uncultured Lichenicoccus sp.]
MPLLQAATLAVQDNADIPTPRELLLEALHHRGVDQRRRAARALAGDPETAFVLAACLPGEPDAGVRDALFAGLIQVGGLPAAEIFGRLLGSEDVNLRVGAVEALKHLEEDAIPVIDRLLGDPDPDSRMLAVEVLRAWSRSEAIPRLRRVIETDQHVNVCAAAVDVAAEIGTAALVGSLGGLRRRFAEDPFLIFAVDVACEQSASPRGAR